MSVAVDYPATATEARLSCSGPLYFGTSLPKPVSSFLEIANISGVGTEIPKWRQAYLSKELPCSPTDYSPADARDRSSTFWRETSKACGDDVFGSGWSCSRGERMLGDDKEQNPLNP